MQRLTGRRHPVLPAHEAAHLPKGRVVHLETMSVAVAPDQTFAERRDELAVAQRKRPVGSIQGVTIRGTEGILEFTELKQILLSGSYAEQ